VPISLITGPANAGKARLVMDSVRREAARGREPLLIVPTRADAEYYLRELAGDGVAGGVRVERFDGLLREAVGRAGIAGPRLEGIARERVLQALAARNGVVRPSGGYLSALGELFAELQMRRVGPGRFVAALASWAAADGEDAGRARLGRIYSDYRATLERLGRPDAEQQAVAALDALRERPALWGERPVLFYGFDDLTPLQLDAIETLGRVVDAEVTVSLAYEPGRVAFAARAGVFEELRPLAGNVRELTPRAEHYAAEARPVLSHLERSLFEAEASRLEAGETVQLLEGGGERAELELVASEVARLIEDGIEAEQIAVLARPPLLGSELLREVFAAAGVPIATRARPMFADTPVGRGLIGLLRSVEAPGDALAGNAAELLMWLRTPGLLDQEALADRLEADLMRRGLTGAFEARALWEERHWPLERLERMQDAQARGPLALLERAGVELGLLFAAPRRGQASVLSSGELEDAQALSEGRRALGELRELARQAPELAPSRGVELAESLAGIELAGPESPAGGAVAVLDPLALRARRVRALFLCGLQEGIFPARSRPEPLLSEEERARLAELSGLRLVSRGDTLAAERHLFYAVLSRPEELLAVSWHVADDEAVPSSRSLFVEDLCDLFTDGLMERRRRRALGAVEGPAAGPLLPAFRAGPVPLLDERLLAGLRERLWSASSLERWLGCPVKWYVESMLNPGELDPEAEPLAQGGLAHAALNDTLEGLRRETGSARVNPATLPVALELLEQALELHEPSRSLSVTPARRAAIARRLRSDLERYLTHAAEAEGGLEPAHLELGFGFDEEDDRGEGSTLGPLDLGAGVRMRGRIDRVDLTPSGEAVLLDYKSGKVSAVKKWEEEGKLQLALYMLAVEQLLERPAVAGLYQPLSGKLQARGVIDADAELELEAVRNDVLEHEAVRELLDRAALTAREIAAQAGRGELEARPDSCAWGGGCSYPSICRCER
jgi:ATP-dependent helicase/DNAse subunit B